MLVCIRRRVLIPVNAEATTTDADTEAQHHIPHVHMPARLRGMVLSQRCYVLYRKNSRVIALQLPVSLSYLFFFASILLTIVCGKRINVHQKTVEINLNRI